MYKVVFGGYFTHKLMTLRTSYRLYAQPAELIPQHIFNANNWKIRCPLLGGEHTLCLFRDFHLMNTVSSHDDWEPGGGEWAYEDYDDRKNDDIDD